MDSSNLEGVYPSSTAYWFIEMKKGENEYERCLLWTVVAVDRSNSTHLETVKDGSVGMRDKILIRCPDLVMLTKKFEKDIQSPSGDHLLYDICEEVAVEGKDTTRKNLSFAFEFCAHMHRSTLDAVEGTQSMTMSLLPV